MATKTGPKPALLATYLMSFPEVREEQPFSEGVDVYKVKGKIFAILSPEAEPPSISLKCEPALAVELRHEYDAISAGYHLNKKHWNTVELDGSIPVAEVKDMIRHSFERVVMAMPKLERARLLAR